MKGTWQTADGPGGRSIVPVVAIIAAAAVIGSGAVSAIVYAIAIVIVVTGCTIALAIAGLAAAVVMVHRKTLEHAAMLDATRAERLAAAVRPQAAAAPLPAAVEQHIHHHHGPEFHIYGEAGQAAAAPLIRNALSGEARRAITEGE